MLGGGRCSPSPITKVIWQVFAGLAFRQVGRTMGIAWRPLSGLLETGICFIAITALVRLLTKVVLLIFLLGKATLP